MNVCSVGMVFGVCENDRRRSYRGATLGGVFQVVLIPHGAFENDFEKYLVAIVSLALLCFAACRFFSHSSLSFASTDAFFHLVARHFGTATSC